MRQRYVDAVCREACLRASDSPSADTIYIGGGTPSLLTAAQLHQLFDNLYYIYKVEDGAEVTIEVNPDDVTDAFAKELSLLPVNRVSMGAQTFGHERLKFLRRRHTPQQVLTAVKRLRDAGIRNLSVDLMYGFPDETIEQWQYDIDAALALDVEHISAYCLTVEEETALFELMNKGQITRNDEETERQMYYTLIDRLAANGYEHYEISNFARPGMRSRHNGSYWTDVPYTGLGAAAHSYDGHCRSWNVSDINLYIEGIECGKPDRETEETDSNTWYNDRVMLALRTCEGLDLTTLSTPDHTYLMNQAQRYLDEGLLRLTDNRLQLTREGLFVSDMVTSDLMKV